MKAKSIVLKGAKVEATEADREILSNYLNRYELLEFPKDEKAYTLTDEDFFEIEVTLFGTTYQLELFPYELRTDDYQSAVDGKIVEGTRSPCRTFRGTVKIRTMWLDSCSLRTVFQDLSNWTVKTYTFRDLPSLI